jgi:hypothetical protein
LIFFITLPPVTFLRKNKKKCNIHAEIRLSYRVRGSVGGQVLVGGL